MTVSLFSITPTPPTSITLAAGGEGKFSFTITCLAAPDKTYDLILQVLLVGADGTTHEADWLVPGPQPALHMTGGETQTVAIAVKPTATSPVGQNRVKLAVADKARPNDTFAYSAPVVVEIAAPSVVPRPAKKFPWWIVAVAGGAVVLAGAGILIWKLASRGGGTPVVVDAGPADAAPPRAFAPLHVLHVLPDAPDLILRDHPVTIDTSQHTIDGAGNPFLVQQGDYTVLFTKAFTVGQPLVIQGTAPLVVVASGAITVAAGIDLEATGVSSGPGAAPVGGLGAGGAGGTGTTGGGEFPMRLSSGGGGGSHGTLGGPGGSSAPTAAPEGPSGVRYGVAPTDPLIGGAPGGNGGRSAGTTGMGGGGGGALQLSSATSIQINATINAGGAGGRGGGTGDVGGGGGGAGGTILLEAPVIAIAGTLAANGGGGGGGGASGPNVGRDGTEGGVTPATAPGGVGGQPRGSAGGNGAAGVTGGLVEAQPGRHNNSNGGGGGGGAGRIWLRFRAATPPTLTGIITPPAGMDPSLP